MVIKIFFLCLIFIFQFFETFSQKVERIDLLYNNINIVIDTNVSIFLFEKYPNEIIKTQLTISNKGFEIPESSDSIISSWLVIKYLKYYFTFEIIDFKENKIIYCLTIDYHDNKNLNQLDLDEQTFLKDHRKFDAFYSISIDYVRKFYIIKKLKFIKKLPDFYEEKNILFYKFY
jgi:hypothetical protein